MATMRQSVLQRFVRMLYPPMPTLNVIPARILSQIQAAIFKPKSLILNVGSGGLSGCGRRLWQENSCDECTVVHMDLGLGEAVSVLGDAHRLPFSDRSFDAVVMQAVVEHLFDPDMATSEVWRVLRPGGVLYVEMPFLQGFHADPHDYQRYTLEGLRRRLALFNEELSGVSVGPFCTFVWLLRDGFSSCFRNRWLYVSSRFIWGWLLSPLRYMDILIRSNQAAYRLANEYYFLCRKPKI